MKEVQISDGSVVFSISGEQGQVVLNRRRSDQRVSQAHRHAKAIFFNVDRRPVPNILRKRKNLEIIVRQKHLDLAEFLPIPCALD